MIDLHCHILPGVDDGAFDVDMSLRMAEMFVADGVTTVAATPHILPGRYDNRGSDIRVAVAQLQEQFDKASIPLRLVEGADVHVDLGLVKRIQDGEVLPLGGTRYILIEPPHHNRPHYIEQLFFDLTVAGYVPILTHPERLSWVYGNYEVIETLLKRGAWMQLTSGSLAGNFGRRAQSLSEHMLRAGHVHILATDAHNLESRPPDLSHGRDLAAGIVGEQEAHRLVHTRPAAILDNIAPNEISSPQAVDAREGKNGPGEARSSSMLAANRTRRQHSSGSRLFGGMRRLFGRQ